MARPWSSTLTTALAGPLAAAAGLAVGHLLAALTSPATSPVLVVGSTVIDRTPTPVKEWAIARFGTDDKAFLVGSVLAVVLLAAVGAGLLARRRPVHGAAALATLACVAAVLALLRPAAGPAAVL
ncbi:oxidoreductase, partial [Nocardioides sp. CER28]